MEQIKVEKQTDQMEDGWMSKHVAAATLTAIGQLIAIVQLITARSKQAW